MIFYTFYTFIHFLFFYFYVFYKSFFVELYIGHDTRFVTSMNAPPSSGSNRSFSSGDISEAADFLSLPVYMPEEMINNQDDNCDAVEKFGTGNLLIEWRGLLKDYSASYSTWLKKSKLFQQKIINIKQSLHKDLLKTIQPLANQAKHLSDDLIRIPCSAREADDFQAFFEAFTWVIDLLEVRTFIQIISYHIKMIFEISIYP